jgi:hypothetical protein
MFFYGYTCHDIDECFAGTHLCSAAEHCVNIIAHKDFKGVGYKCVSERESGKQFSEAMATSFEQTGVVQLFEIPDALDINEMTEYDEENSSFPKKLCNQYFGGSIEKILSDAEVDSSRWIIRYVKLIDFVLTVKVNDSRYQSTCTSYLRLEDPAQRSQRVYSPKRRRRKYSQCRSVWSLEYPRLDIEDARTHFWTRWRLQHHTVASSVVTPS